MKSIRYFIAIPNFLYPYIQHLPKSLIRHRRYFHYQLISDNVLIRIWSAIDWLCFVKDLTIGCVFHMFKKLNDMKMFHTESNKICLFCVLSELKQGTIIISKVILFNQPWFQCYFFLKKHKALCNFHCTTMLPLQLAAAAHVILESRIHFHIKKCTSTLSSVPVLDDPVPATRGHFWGFVRVPQHAHTHVIVCLEFVVQFCRLPVPHIHFAVSISRN